MKTIASEDAVVGGKTIRTFTVVVGRATQRAIGRHFLRVHTQYGAVDAMVLLQAGKMFGALGRVHHVSATHHREWKVWVEVQHGV